MTQSMMNDKTRNPRKEVFTLRHFGTYKPETVNRKPKVEAPHI